MSKNIIRIEQNGHVYRVVPVEGSDKWDFLDNQPKQLTIDFDY